MRLLVLGAGGMLGHRLLAEFLERGHETFGTLRGDPTRYQGAATVLGGVDAMDFGAVQRAVDRAKPDAVVNCVGVIKQRAAAKDLVPSIALNALLPHRLADLGPRLVHFSTDCVFRGERGPYRLGDPTDAIDLYGRTKAMGEVAERPNAVTLRTSIVGRELTEHASLVDWFLAQQSSVRGFTNALYTGMTTGTMAGLVLTILEDHPALWGLYQAAGDPISKYGLLRELDQAFGKNLAIAPDGSFHCDRRLDGSALETAIGWKAPDWPVQIAGLATDKDHSKDWR